jgi:hypothetical protein
LALFLLPESMFIASMRPLMPGEDWSMEVDCGWPPDEAEVFSSFILLVDIDML